jgi:uncharacterized caspase-like protein
LRGAGFKKVIVVANLARDELVKALHDFQAEADRADWALIYFAGHGVAIGSINYVVPTDAHLKTDLDVPDEAVSLDRLMDRVGGARKLKIVILDACRDNPFAAKMQQTLAFRSANRAWPGSNRRPRRSSFIPRRTANSRRTATATIRHSRRRSPNISANLISKFPNSSGL